MPKMVPAQRDRASTDAWADPERTDTTSASALTRLVCTTVVGTSGIFRLEYRAVAPPHGAREKRDDDGPGVLRKALRPAHDDRVHTGASDHSDLAAERKHEPAAPAPTYPNELDLLAL
jgi:hypothetical protein